MGANRSGPDTITETKSFYPERVGTNRFCVFIYYGGTYQKVADVVFNYQPSAPPGSPPGGSSATLRTDPIWSQIGLFPGTDWYYVNDKVGPSYINSWRFVELAKATGTRWALSYLGTTNQAPLRDGDNVVGFSYDVRPGVLGVEIEYLRNKYRRKRLCRKHRHRSGRSHRHCRRGKRRKVGTVLTGEKDVTINATTPWSQAPGRPASHLYDLETVLIHELGHFAGNGSHVHGCVNSPLIDVFDTGEWWRGTNDWGRYGCSNATYRRKPAPGTQQGRMIRITVPPGERGPDPGSGIQSRLSP